MIILLFRHAWRWISTFQVFKLLVLQNAELRIPTIVILVGLTALYPFMLLICLLHVLMLSCLPNFAKRLAASRINR